MKGTLASAHHSAGLRTTSQPRLAQAGLRVQGLEGGVMVVEGTVASPDDRALALATARQVAGVRDVVDRMAGP